MKPRSRGPLIYWTLYTDVIMICFRKILVTHLIRRSCKVSLEELVELESAEIKKIIKTSYVILPNPLKCMTTGLFNLNVEKLWLVSIWTAFFSEDSNSCNSSDDLEIVRAHLLITLIFRGYLRYWLSFIQIRRYYPQYSYTKFTAKNLVHLSVSAKK